MIWISHEIILTCDTSNLLIATYLIKVLFYKCYLQSILNLESCYKASIYRKLSFLVGFGSMLRAIGAQIEKTTSREACRDLSGRRMRDVNNEKK